MFEDRVLRVFVDSLKDFDHLIGGSKYIPKFMPIFEKLCYSEDVYVRERTYGRMTQGRAAHTDRAQQRVRKQTDPVPQPHQETQHRQLPNQQVLLRGAHLQALRK